VERKETTKKIFPKKNFMRIKLSNNCAVIIIKNKEYMFCEIIDFVASIGKRLVVLGIIPNLFVERDGGVFSCLCSHCAHIVRQFGISKTIKTAQVG